MNQYLDKINKLYINEPEFLEAFKEIYNSLLPIFEEDEKYFELFNVLSHPERIITFKVPWTNDNGKLNINTGYRVQFNSALGPYKGGLRFHPSVNLSILKFLAFEQTLKNSLTGMNLGGAKGGSDFDPKGKSLNEIRSFCQSFMTELSKYIGSDIDIPAGDIGVSSREIGFLFGQYRRLNISFNGIITGKDLDFGGSLLRPEATGYGVVYFAKCILKDCNDTLEEKRCLISGSGNVAQFAAEKLLSLKAKVLSFSDSEGTLIFNDGLTVEELDELKEFKIKKRGRLSEFRFGEFYRNSKPWKLTDCDIAFPCATQNELTEEDATVLAENCRLVVEGANMPCTSKAIEIFKKKKIIFAPGKAANAGGVAVSAMEMSQNASKLSWSREEVDEKLINIMNNIYKQCKETAKAYNFENDLQYGANICGFLRVVNAMEKQGYF